MGIGDADGGAGSPLLPAGADAETRSKWRNIAIVGHGVIGLLDVAAAAILLEVHKSPKGDLEIKNNDMARPKETTVAGVICAIYILLHCGYAADQFMKKKNKKTEAVPTMRGMQLAAIIALTVWSIAANTEVKAASDLDILPLVALATTMFNAFLTKVPDMVVSKVSGAGLCCKKRTGEPDAEAGCCPRFGVRGK
ncbi:MAG: hypothetical protein K0U29_08820 [Gammaproteobacteria bacterium]|nr:hypothetical protein [Gammaproteobacteria bacterium]MCH9745015.1 hypothetical protein [Gammaproteobacteria bacterium]